MVYITEMESSKYFPRTRGWNKGCSETLTGGSGCEKNAVDAPACSSHGNPHHLPGSSLLPVGSVDSYTTKQASPYMEVLKVGQTSWCQMRRKLPKSLASGAAVWFAAEG